MENMSGWLFIAPLWILVAIFTAFPLYDSLRLSFRKWNPLGLDEYVGLANYQELANDWVFWLAYKNALYYALYTIPAGLVWGIAVALALQNIRWRAFLRALYFMPTVTSSVAIAIFWALIFQSDFGLLNNFLSTLGIEGPNWLGHTAWALPSVSLVVVWMGTGYWMVIFLAALLDIPQDYIDAAKVDGATFWQGFRYVTLPLLTPSIFFYITNGLITVWLQFEIVYVMTSGGPANSTLMPAVHLYSEAWSRLRMGYASSIAWVMAVIIFALTALHFYLARKWVHYDFR
ncbi:sugar ABC transporter permease [Chloroflexi bacterium TSY]|nr:sugar ABC transporter permease [Chloroflexi bacterium TSY]